MPAVFKVGGWYATTDFPDIHLGVTATGAPISLASPLSVGPLNHQGNWGIYEVIDEMIWRAGKGPQSLNAFLRGTASPSDRNLVVGYIDGGLGLKAPLPGRDDDVLTAAFAYSAVSPDASALDIDTAFFTGAPFPVRNSEFLIDVDYSFQIAPWWTLQLDGQYIFRPGGNVPNPLNPAQTIPNAFVGFVRNTIKF